MAESTETPKSFGGIPVDPRVEWAMHVMDTEGMDFRTWYEKLTIPGMGAMVPLMTLMTNNAYYKVPMRTNMPLMLIGMPIGGFCAFKAWEWKQRVNAENMALARHYILTHPEKFPAPKSPKIGELILPWIPCR